VRVGVIGGGQLARMMIPAAIELGVELRVLAEAEGMSAALAADRVGDYTDAETVLAFARDVDVVTFDHEHVPQDVLRLLVDEGIPVHPGPDALRFAQDKLLMRERLSELGLPVPDWARVTTTGELDDFIADHGGSAVVKTPRGGYDGKGVRVVRSAAEVAEWFATVAEDGRGGALLARRRHPDCCRVSATLASRTGDNSMNSPFTDCPVSSLNSTRARSKGSSSCSISPLGMDQAPLSLFFQKGPPG